MRPILLTLVFVLCIGVAGAATVGYVTYGGAERPAINDDDAWVKAMREADISVELLKTTELLDAAIVARYNALYVPDTIAFTEAGFSALKRYVAAGGWLLLQGRYSATALDKSGKDIFEKGKYAWVIIYLDKGACRTGILPATGAGAGGAELDIAKLRIAAGSALTNGTQTGVVLDMPKRPNGKPYLSAPLHYFPAVGARPIVSGVPQTTAENQQPEPVALATHNEYGKGSCLWLTLPVPEMAADGVDFAKQIVENTLAAISANPLPAAEDLSRIIPTMEETNSDLKALDAAFRGGKGYSDSADSGDLGWGEASRLLTYIKAYTILKDTYWLDKIIDHFDRMIAGLSDPDGDGYRGWQTITYSDALGRPTADPANTGNARIEPELVRARKNTDVTGHTYTIEFTAPGEFQIADDDTAELLIRRQAYKSGEPITAIPGIKVTISGQPAQGDEFQVRTEQVLPLEWAVHDGTITYPIALFIETVKKDNALQEQYGEKADEYSKLLMDNFLKKWEYVWIEPAAGMGLLKWEPIVANPYLRDIPTDEIPTTTKPIPHNQYLALGRTYLVMADVVDKPEADHYRDIAEKMARFFKSKLRPTGKAYTFAYWDPVEGISDGADDIGHGGLSLSFAIEAANRGVVFDDDDMQRFSHTLLDQIWNGSLDDPKFAKRVNGEGEGGAGSGHWVALSSHNDEVWRLFWAIFRQKPDTYSFLNLWHARPEIAEAPPATR